MEEKTTLTMVKIQRNPKFVSITDGVVDDPETGFPPSITDSSRYESIQSIEARCMRGEVVLNNPYTYEFDGEVSEDDLDGSDMDNLDEGELDENIDQRAEILYNNLKAKEAELPTTTTTSDKFEKSEEASAVDNSAIAAGD